MSMSTPTARQPKGVPAGGQFAAITRTEPGIALRAETSPVILPGSCVGYGGVVAQHVHEDGSESSVRAMTTTPEFDNQLRTYLGVEDSEAPVSMSIESIFYEDEEGQMYSASCDGKEATFGVLDNFLTRMGTAVAAASAKPSSPHTS
jgi:hypothetical protein